MSFLCKLKTAICLEEKTFGISDLTLRGQQTFGEKFLGKKGNFLALVGSKTKNIIQSKISLFLEI